MITMTCKCGTSTLKFNNLNEKDFPNGWENDCCSEVVSVAGSVEFTEEVKPEEAEYWEDKILDKVMKELPTTAELPDLSEEDVAEIAEQVAADSKPKKRGRKPKDKK